MEFKQQELTLQLSYDRDSSIAGLQGSSSRYAFNSKDVSPLLLLHAQSSLHLHAAATLHAANHPDVLVVGPPRTLSQRIGPIDDEINSSDPIENWPLVRCQ